MKKLLLLAASVAVLAACTKDATVDNGAKVNPADGVIAFTGTSNSLACRTTMADNASNGFDVKWAVGDQIGIFADDANGSIAINYAFSAQTVGTSSEFIPASASDKIGWGTGAHDFYAYYPRTTATDATAVPASVPAEQTQSAAGNTEHLAPLAFLWAKNEGITKPTSNAITLQFSNVFSVLELDLTSPIAQTCSAFIFRCTSNASEVVSASGAKVNVKTGAVDYSSATTSNQIKLNLTTPVTISTTPQKFYMMITPGHAGQRFDIIAVVNGSEYIMGTKKIPTGIPVGVKANIPLVPVVDLSRAGTSNCYIVSAPGTYRFKATVKGNGVVPTTMSGYSTTIAPTKVRLMWQACASSYYAGSKSAYGSDGSMSLLIKRTSVELHDGYVYFTTPKTLSPGNAVICATDDSNNVLWSWHLWIAPGYDAEASAFSPTANANCTGITMMDRNLGAFGNGKNASFTNKQNSYAAFGLVYQWGRKDPFHVENVDGWKYGNVQAVDGTISEFTNVIASEYQSATDWQTGVENSIAKPTTFFKAVGAAGVDNSYLYFWANKGASPASDGWYALWGNDTYSQDKAAGKKTIFDPCPQGWRVAAPRSYGFFNAYGSDMAAIYHYQYPCRWNFDQSVAGLLKVSGTSVTLDPDGAGTYGYNCYTKSAMADSTVVRSDLSTNFFPALGVETMYGSRVLMPYVIMMTNSPVSAASNEYRIARICKNGSVYFSDKGEGTTYDCPVTAAPLRCIKDIKE